MSPSHSYEKAAAGVNNSGVLGFLGNSPKKLLIDGKWVSAKLGRTFESINPANEEILAVLAEADKADVDEAVRSARKAFESGPWAAMGPYDRAGYLFKIADLIEQHIEELSLLDTLDMGCPVGTSTAFQTLTVRAWRYYAGWVTKIYGETNPSDPGIFNYTLREPVGVCAGIIPWNAPSYLGANKIAPALACGNTIIVKPASQASLSLLRLGELILEAGVPAGVVNIITGGGATAGKAIVEHPGIDKISFTGSTEVGKSIILGSAGNIKRVSLELGGKSPNIVFADADLAQALGPCMYGFCANSGQICLAPTRIFAQKEIYDKFVADLTAITASIKPGNPLDPNTIVGPLANAGQFKAVKNYLEIGKKEGATITTGGSAVPGKGYFVNPTVFANVSNNMRIAQEEIFGPVGVVIPFKDEEDVIAMANDTIYGLGGSLWTKDLSRAIRVARALKTGEVNINTVLSGDPMSPMGGYKQSGYGREQGKYALDLFTQVKSVFVKL
jgi:acyl-CoA reductase-like NAD-dependent aldehyde dehydrogenase